jgi:hypothetical protein
MVFSEKGAEPASRLNLKLRNDLSKRDFVSFQKNHEELGRVISEPRALLEDLKRLHEDKHVLWGLAAESVANNRLTPEKAMDILSSRLMGQTVHYTAIKKLLESKKALEEVGKATRAVQSSHSVAAPDKLHKAYVAHLDESIAKLKKIKEKELLERF